MSKGMRHCVAGIVLVLLSTALAMSCAQDKEPSDISEMRKAAEQGDAIAQFNLGLCYALGLGVPKDDVKAVKWYRKAADQGEAVAQWNLGLGYALGLGVPKDEVEAVKWYRKAADQGHAIAQFALGGCYADGQGVPKDDVEAYKWLNLAGQTDEDARESRDELGSKMTSQQIAEARKLSAAWKPKKEH